MNFVYAAAIARRRRAAVGAAVLGTYYIYMNGTPRGDTIERPIFSFHIYIRGIRPTFFKRMYRMPRHAFFVLAEQLEYHHANIRLRSCGLMRLSVTLRWLAGASYLDLAQSHQQSISSVYFHIDRTVAAMDSVLQIRFPYDDERWLSESSYKFSRHGRSPLTGCCAAIDGIAIKIAEPSANDVPNPSTYYNRKGFFALNIQAVCDASYRFLYVSALTPGSTHDSTAFAMSALSQVLNGDQNGLLNGFWVAADEAYVSSHQVVCPWPGRRLSAEEDCFNYWQSSARIHIEQAFGMLVGRWGILWKPLRLSVGKAAQIVAVCCKLHNFIIDHACIVNIPPRTQSDVDNSSDPIDQTVHLQDDCDTHNELHRRRRDLEHSKIREDQTELIRQEGLRRPALY